MAYNIEFTIDLASLERTLDKIDDVIQNTFSPKGLNEFDTKVLDLNKRVQEMSTNMERLGIKMSSAFLSAKQELSEAVAQIQDGNTALVKFSDLSIKSANDIAAARDRLNRVLVGPGASLFSSPQENPERYMPNPRALNERLGALDPRWGASGRFQNGFAMNDPSRLTSQVVGLTKGYQDAMGAMRSFYSAEETSSAKLAKDAQRNADILAKEWQTAANQIDEYLTNAFDKAAAAQQNFLKQRGESGNFVGGSIRDNYRNPLGFTNLLANQTPGLDKGYQEAQKQLRQMYEEEQKVADGNKQVSKSILDVVGHAAQWYVVWQGLYSLFEGIKESAKEGLRTFGEFQEQAVQLNMQIRLLKEVGKYSPSMHLEDVPNAEFFSVGARLAQRYGDNINDVVQDLTMWYKTTGNLNDAMAVTNEALKFQLATGTDLEDVYRTLTALTNQARGVQMGNGDKSAFDLSKTHELLNMIYTAALVAGAGMRQITAGGGESVNNINNAAGILLHSLEQDTESIKSLGLSMAQIIALNQSLIQAMGNTGSEADSAAERVARLMGGIAELSHTNKSTSLLNDIGQDAFNKLNNLLANRTGPGFLDDFARFYESLNSRQQAALATQIAGNRQYQITKAMVDQIFNSYEKILQAEKDKKALDEAAKQMMDTFNTQVAQLQAQWQTVVAIIGKDLIPLLETAMTLAAQIGVNFAIGFERVSGFVQGGSDSNIQDILSKTKDAQDPLGEGGHLSLYALLSKRLLDPNYRKKLTPAEWNAVNNIVRDNKSDQEMLVDLGYNRKQFTSSPLVEKIAPEFSDTGSALAGESKYEFEHRREIADYAFRDAQKSALMKQIGNIIAPPKQPGQKGIETPAGLEKSALDDLINQYHVYVSGIEAAIEVDQAHVSILQHKLGLFGPTTAGLKGILAGYADQAAILKGSIPELESYRQQLERQKSGIEANMAATPASKRNTTQFAKWGSDLDQVRTAIAEVDKEISGNGVKAMEAYMNALDAVNRVAKEYYDQVIKIDEENIRTATKGYDAGTVSLEGVIKAYQKLASDGTVAIGHMVRGSVEWKNAMQDMHDKGAQAIDDLKQKWDNYTKSVETTLTQLQSKGIESAFSILDKAATTPEEKADYTYYKEMIKIQQDNNQLMIQYNQLMKEAGDNDYLKGLAQNLLDMGQATESLDAETAAYLRDMESLQDSGFLTSLQQTIQSISSNAGEALANQLFGNNAINDQIFGMDQLISKYQEEKQWLDMSFSSIKNKSAQEQANEKLQIYMLDQQIKKQEQLKKAEQDRLNHPGLMKQFEMTFTKGIVDSIVKQMQQQVTNSIMNAFMPKADKDLVNAMQKHVQGMRDNFKVPSETLNKMIQDTFDPDIQKYFQDSTKQFDDTVKKPLTDAFKGFDTTVKDPFAGAIKNFGDYVQSFTNAVNSLEASQGGKFTVDPNAPTGSGSSDVYFNTSVLNTKMGDSAMLAILASGNYAPDHAISDYYKNADIAGQTQQALGFGGASDIFGGGGTVGSSVIGLLTGGAINSVASGGGMLAGAGNGFLQMLLGLGGGGSPLGAATAGLGLISAFGASPNKGNFALGSLAGVLGAGGIMAALTGSTVFGSIGMAALGGPIGIGILLGSALLGGTLGGMIGPHYNPSKNPDMFGNDGYAQGIANAQGVAYTSANGWVNEDPALSQALGGQTQLQYLDQFVKAHPNGQGLTGSSLALWQQVNAFTHGGTTLGANAVPNGGVMLSTGPNNTAPNIPGTQMPWQDFLNQMNNMTNSVQQYTDALKQGSDQLIVGFNQFGSNMAFFPYAWQIPGYNMPANPGQSPIGSPSTGSPGTPTSPTPTQPGANNNTGTGNGGGGYDRGGGGNQVGQQSAYTYRPSYTAPSEVIPVQLNSTITLDGRKLAISTQSYQLQAYRRGYTRIS